MNRGAALSGVATRRGLLAVAFRGLKPTATFTRSLRDVWEVDASARQSCVVVFCGYSFGCGSAALVFICGFNSSF